MRAPAGSRAVRPEGRRRQLFELLLSFLSRIDQRFDPAVPGIAVSDHVLDDEACWCGVPLECHDDLYDAIRGWHHQPDPIPPTAGHGDPRQPVAVTGHLAGKRRECEPAPR
jgi:hypothetical protein